jgi:hypothetical protein
MTKEALLKEVSELYKSVGMGFDRSSPETLISEGEYRSQWLARSAELVGEAQFIHDKARGAASEKYMDVKATLMREFVGRDCADEARLLKLAERLNATITHQCDMIRTIISFEKESRKRTM